MRSLISKNSIKTLFYAAVLTLISIYALGCSYLPLETNPPYVQKLYKRLPYAMEGRYRSVDIFYATTRKIDEVHKDSTNFTNSPSEELTCGNINVRIKPSLKIGRMMPHFLKASGLMGVQAIEKFDRKNILKKITEAVKASPHKSLLILVFGYQDNFESTAIKAAFFSYHLDVNTPILVFDWPGDQPLGVDGYLKARLNAKRSGKAMGELLVDINKEVKPDKLWIMGSSLGCQVICDAFENMSENRVSVGKEPAIDLVVFAAPDVSQHDYDKKFKDNMLAFTKKVTAYVSSNDDALLASEFISGGTQRLGLQRVENPRELDEAKDLLYLKSLEPQRITIIDVTPINNASYRHGYYLECPEFFDDLYLRIFNLEPNVNRRLYLLKYKNDVDYWILQGSD